MRKQEIIVGNEGERVNLIRFLTRVSLDKPLKVTVEENRKRRSLSQLALYWSWLHEVADKIAEHTGYSAEEVHDIMKQKFLKPKPVTIGGVEHWHYTTKGLSVAEMSEYIDKVYAFAVQELGIFLPLPEERFADRAA